MNVKKKFIKLTKYTYPYGTEGFLKNHLPNGFQTDQFGNFFFQIGESSTMFTCHLDTASSKQEKVKHIFTGNLIQTDGTTILGADDKAGMVVLLYMIENKIPGLYYFFLGEELGCIGSGNLAEVWEDISISKTINKVVSFDRRGTQSVITHQLSDRCCSDEFGQELANRLNSTGLNYKLDNTGIFTDSAKFMYIVPECTNLSVGYYNEHSHNETQNINHLQKLCESVVKIDWETLPVTRNLDELRDYYGIEKEEEFSSSYFSYFNISGKTKKMFISKTKIEKETSIIFDWVKANGWEDATEILWNGNTLHVQTNSSTRYEFVSNRFELSELIDDLSTVENKHLSDKPSSKNKIAL